MIYDLRGGSGRGKSDMLKRGLGGAVGVFAIAHEAGDRFERRGEKDDGGRRGGAV